MKLSEAIAELKLVLDNHGDLELKTWPYAGQIVCHPVVNVSFVQFESGEWNAEKNRYDLNPCEPYAFIAAE